MAVSSPLYAHVVRNLIALPATLKNINYSFSISSNFCFFGLLSVYFPVMLSILWAERPSRRQNLWKMHGSSPRVSRKRYEPVWAPWVLISRNNWKIKFAKSLISSIFQAVYLFSHAFLILVLVDLVTPFDCNPSCARKKLCEASVFIKVTKHVALMCLSTKNNFLPILHARQTARDIEIQQHGKLLNVFFCFLMSTHTLPGIFTQVTLVDVNFVSCW